MAVDLNTIGRAGEGIEAAPDQDFEDLPPGNYQMRVEECHFKQTKSGNNWMLVFKLKVISGEHKGRVHYWYHVLYHTDPEKIAWYRRDIEKLGFPRGGNLSTIGQYTSKFCNLVLEINLKLGTKLNNNGVYPTFTRLNKVVELGAGANPGLQRTPPQGDLTPPGGAPATALPPEDEIPF